MFTGIIQQTGRVASAQKAADGLRLVVEPSIPINDLEAGESIANDGVCLTVESGSTPGALKFFLSPETLGRTTLGGIKPCAVLNLERSLSVGGRMGGHFVMGHVDAVGEIRRLDPLGESWELEVGFPPLMRPYLAPKGSVAVDGISLTVVEVKSASFTIAVIPHTREVTSLRNKRPGAQVNLEADVIARYVAGHLAGAGGGGSHLDALLAKAGFTG